MILTMVTDGKLLNDNLLRDGLVSRNKKEILYFTYHFYINPYLGPEVNFA